VAVSALAVGLSVAAAGCGGAKPTTVLACPGSPARCPYTGLTVLGNRAGGVLRSPEALAVDARGDVYVGDQYSHVIQKFSRDGRLETEWGSSGPGPGQFGAVGALAVDAQGFVYAIDSTHNRIEKFDANGRFVLAWGQRGSRVGDFDFGAGGGPDRPPGGGITVRGDHVYVADTRNNRIESFRLDGSIPRVLTGSGARRLSDPRGLTTAGQGIYVADNQDRRIELLSPSGKLLRRAGSFGSGPGEFGNPYGVAVNRLGDVFVADDNNNRVVKLGPRLNYVTAWSSLADHSPISYLRAVATDAAGELYVAATARDVVAVFDRDGRPLRQWGVSGATPGEFVMPVDVAGGAAGGLLVAAQFASRSRVDVFDSRLRFTRRLVGGRTTVGHHFFVPSAVAMAPDGTIWATDRDNNLLRHLTQTDALVGLAGSAGPPAARLLAPQGIAIDATGAIYVVDRGHDRVVKFSARGRWIRSWGSRGAGSGQFSRPASIAVDRAGAVYVVDTGNDRVQQFSRSGRFLRAWGRPGGGNGELKDPHGIAIDGAGHAFVADGGNDRIEEFTARGHFVTAWGSYGTMPGQLISPGGLAVTCTGAVAVADTYNNRVQVFDHAAVAVGCAGPAATAARAPAAASR
jgi:tripartite motif-containing protein 71